MIHIATWSSSDTHFSITASIDKQLEMLRLRNLIAPLIRRSFRLKFSTADGKQRDEVEELNLYGKLELFHPPVGELFTIVYDQKSASFRLQTENEMIDDKYVKELTN